MCSEKKAFVGLVQQQQQQLYPFVVTAHRSDRATWSERRHVNPYGDSFWVTLLNWLGICGEHVFLLAPAGHTSCACAPMYMYVRAHVWRGSRVPADRRYPRPSSSGSSSVASSQRSSAPVLTRYHIYRRNNETSVISKYTSGGRAPARFPHVRYRMRRACRMCILLGCDMRAVRVS